MLPLTAAKKVSAETAFNQAKAISTRNTAYFDAEKALEKAKKEAVREWEDEMKSYSKNT